MVLERCQRVLGSAQSIFYKTPPAPRVYFIRLLPRPEYILKDSWQEDYVIHMEIKDLHVAIVFSPICGPIPTGLLGLVLEAHLYEVQDDGDMAPKSRFTEHQKSTLVGHSDSTLDRVQKHHV